MKPVLAILAIRLAMAQQSTQGLQTYQDPQSRFHFTYPAEFGKPSPGTDNGFRNRTAAIRFSEFSAGVHGRRVILGGEAVLATGPPQLDIQAAGGLYDSIGLQIFPAPIAALIGSVLQVLSPAILCDAIGGEQHLDPADRRLSTLTAQQRTALPVVDRMGNIAPKVSHCEVRAETVTFDKESAVNAEGSTRHIYGAVRFLPAPYSNFQLIRGSADAPSAALLRQITDVVNSWREK